MATHTDHHGHGHVDPSVDKRAAYTGLFVAVIFLFTTVFTIVKLTNAKYAGEGGQHPAAAEATK